MEMQRSAGLKVTILIGFDVYLISCCMLYGRWPCKKGLRVEISSHPVSLGVLETNLERATAVCCLGGIRGRL